MNTEKMKILKMLENGEITADEANKLISIISNAQSDNNNRYNNSNSNNNNSNRTSNGYNFDNIANKITNVANKISTKTVSAYFGIEKKTKDIFKNVNLNSISKKNICKEFNYTLISKNNNLNIKGLNGEVVVKGYNGDKLTITAKYVPKNFSHIDIINENINDFYINFNENEFYKVSLEILLPTKYFDNILVNAISSNYLVDNIVASEIKCISKTSNGIVENCDVYDIKIDNTDGKLIVRNVKSNSLNISNINDYINLKNIDCENLYADTLNGEISIVNDYLNAFDNYKWTLETQNNPISIEINTDNVNYDIEAQTSLGKVNILKNNILYYEKNDFKVMAKSENKNNSFKNLNINAQTTNSTIILM